MGRDRAEGRTAARSRLAGRTAARWTHGLDHHRKALMSTERVWVATALRDAADPHISVFDHGFTVGDGVFEAVKAIGGRPFALTRHLNRLASSAAGLGLPPVDTAAVRHAVTETLLANDV